jgi:hypothetical protein
MNYFLLELSNEEVGVCEISSLLSPMVSMTKNITKLTPEELKEVDIEKRTIRGPLNLRRPKPKVFEGTLVRLKVLPSPVILVEEISKTNNSFDTAQCIWFVNNQLNRTTFRVDQLEQIEEIKEEIHTYNHLDITYLVRTNKELRDKIITPNMKIPAIKLLRELTGWGLKECKDAVEAVTMEQKLNWLNLTFTED